MRLAIYCELKENEIPLDYRRKVVSLFKSCLSSYDKEVYDQYYHEKDPIQKEYTFSTFFSSPKMKKDTIEIPNKKLIINFSTSDNILGINFYNAFIKKIGENIKFSDLNVIKITKVVLQKEKKIAENKVTFKIQSPLIVRDHNLETGKDWYYACDDKEFDEIFKRNLYNQLKDKFTKDITNDIENLEIKNVSMKKIIVSSYGIKMASTIGIFEMTGEQYILNEIYQSGAGSKKSLGFSMLDIA